MTACVETATSRDPKRVVNEAPTDIIKPTAKTSKPSSGTSSSNDSAKTPPMEAQIPLVPGSATRATQYRRPVAPAAAIARKTTNNTIYDGISIGPRKQVSQSRP